MIGGQPLVERVADTTSVKRRVILFALHSERGDADDATLYQLDALRPLAARLIVIVEPSLTAEDLAAVAARSDEIVHHEGIATGSAAYRVALDADDVASYDEVLFTGNGWFGPIGSFDEVLARMAASDAGVWRLIETTDRAPEVFPMEGFPRALTPWTWTVVRADVVSSPAWREYWAASRDDSEDAFAEALIAQGVSGSAAFPATLGPRGNPGILAPGALLDAGCPVLLRTVFAQFPPLLDRFAVLVRPIVTEMGRRGYPVELLWRAVVRTTPPAALNALGAMLEILPDAVPAASHRSEDEAPLRVVVLAHVPHLGFVDELADRLRQIPGEFDLIITTTDGRKAAKLKSRLRTSAQAWARNAEVRVTWVPGGRDMGALLIGCRDILLSDRYDVIVRVHGREPRRKTLNIREYGRRYQLENLLSSPGYVQRIFDLFRREPGLGMVFPPIVHIGYGTMGRGWGAYREPAEDLAGELGIAVPFDEVSPLAPYGGMWIGRPSALRLFAEHNWTVGDYHRSRRVRWVELTRVQERLLGLAAAEAGFHCRTVMNREHAQISHTALEFKLDELSTTIRGYPVEQIHLLRRAGWTGYGGVVALTRMYINLNHPRIAAATQPLYRAARNAGLMAKRVLAAVRNEHQDDGSDR
jgi:lipopolysaccharide biosynthesis protein